MQAREGNSKGKSVRKTVLSKKGIKGIVSCCLFDQSLRQLVRNFGYQKDDLRKLYLLPFEVTKEVKLSMFQYKIVHNILCTKSLLLKMKKEDSPRCRFCPADHTIIHLFTECAQATLFWKEFLDWAHGELKIIAFNKTNYVWYC